MDDPLEQKLRIENPLLKKIITITMKSVLIRHGYLPHTEADCRESASFRYQMCHIPEEYPLLDAVA